jgi:hypothetical protein
MAGDPIPSRSCAQPAAPVARRPAPGGRRARALGAILLTIPLLAPAATAERRQFPVRELPPAACDVCAPGKEPPPPEVQQRLRRINRDANWRREPVVGDTIPLGTATRVWLQRAWASGRLQSGVANPGGGAAASSMPAFRAGARRQGSASLASRSRSRLADRRSLQDQGRGSRSRRGSEASSSSSSSRSTFDSRSLRGTNRSANPFASEMTGGMQ